MASRPGLWRAIRSLPRPVWLLFLGSFINRFGSFVITFLVLYLVHLGYSPAEAGFAVSAYGVGALASAPVGGLLADRLGRRNAIAVSMFSAAAAAMALSIVRSLPAVIVLTAVFGFMSELYRPASAALLSDMVPEGERVPAFAGYRLAINLGFAAGPAVAGFLAGRSFFFLFLGEALTSAAYGFIALAALPHGVRSRRQEERRGESVRTIARDVPFVIFLVSSVLIAFVYMQSSSSFALHVRANVLSTAVYGGLIALNGAMIVLIELPIVAFIRRLAARPVIAAGNLLVAVGFGLTALAHDVPALAATVAVWTFGEIVGASVSSAYVADLAPKHLRGRYQSAFGLTFSVALILAPAVGAALFERSATLLWTVCGVLGAIAAVLVMAIPERRVDPDVARPEAGPEVPGIET